MTHHQNGELGLLPSAPITRGFTARIFAKTAANGILSVTELAAAELDAVLMLAAELAAALMLAAVLMLAVVAAAALMLAELLQLVLLLVVQQPLGPLTLVLPVVFAMLQWH